MENRIYLSSLLDFYGMLLTDKQREICSYYYNDDLSLQEISEIEKISRAAVSDALKRSRQELNVYEERLHLFASYQKRSALYKEIRQLGNEKIGALVDACIETEME